MRTDHVSSFSDRIVISLQIFPLVMLLMSHGRVEDVATLTLGLLGAMVPTALYSAFAIHPLVPRYYGDTESGGDALLSQSFSLTVAFSLSYLLCGAALDSCGSSPLGRLLSISFLISSLNCAHEYLVIDNRLSRKDISTIVSNFAEALGFCSAVLLLVSMGQTPTIKESIWIFLFSRSMGIFSLYLGSKQIRKRRLVRPKLLSDFASSINNFTLYLSSYVTLHGYQYLISEIYGARVFGMIASFQSMFRPLALLSAGDQHFRLSQWSQALSSQKTLPKSLKRSTGRILLWVVLSIVLTLVVSSPLYRVLYHQELLLDGTVQALACLGVFSSTLGGYVFTFLVAGRKSKTIGTLGLRTFLLFCLFSALSLHSLHLAMAIPSLVILSSLIWVAASRGKASESAVAKGVEFGVPTGKGLPGASQDVSSRSLSPAERQC